MGGFEQEKHLKPLVAGIIILLILCSVWIYSLHQKNLAGFERKIVSARSELTQLIDSLQKFKEIDTQLRLTSPEGAPGNYPNLISTVENATEQVSARDLLIYIRPQPDKTHDDLVEEGVEIKLEKLKLYQLVELLYQFDKPIHSIKVSQLRVRTRFDNPEQLDTSITLSRFREKP